jgi:hypothetical protein
MASTTDTRRTRNAVRPYARRSTDADAGSTDGRRPDAGRSTNANAGSTDGRRPDAGRSTNANAGSTDGRRPDAGRSTYAYAGSTDGRRPDAGRSSSNAMRTRPAMLPGTRRKLVGIRLRSLRRTDQRGSQLRSASRNLLAEFVRISSSVVLPPHGLKVTLQRSPPRDPRY